MYAPIDLKNKTPSMSHFTILLFFKVFSLILSTPTPQICSKKQGHIKQWVLVTLFEIILKTDALFRDKLVIVR